MPLTAIGGRSIHGGIQEQIEEMKKKEERLEKQLAETQAENRRLHDPLQKVSIAYGSLVFTFHHQRLVKKLMNYTDS